MFLRIGFAVALLALAGTARADDNEALVKYYRKKNNLPTTAPITVSDVKDSVIKGAKQGTLSVGNQKVGFVASPDLHYVVFGEVDDITIDPSKAVMEKISLAGQPFKGGTITVVATEKMTRAARTPRSRSSSTPTSSARSATRATTRSRTTSSRSTATRSSSTTSTTRCRSIPGPSPPR